MKKFFLILFLLIGASASATKYYVSSSGGSDLSDGLSELSAWKTIAKVNSKTFLPGDAILFKSGDVWRETLVVSSSGNSGAYISYSSYEAGVKPKIYGSSIANNWSNVGNNIWRSAVSLTNPYVESTGDLFFVANSTNKVTFGKPKTYTSDFSGLLSEYDWAWSSGAVYVYAASDPDYRYSSIEAGQRKSCIYLNGKEYIEVNGIDMFYAQRQGVMEKEPAGGLNGYKLRNCEIAYNGTINGYGYASRVVYSNALFEFNTIHDCGRRGISLYNYSGQDLNNIIIQNNVFYNGNHTTGIDIGAGTSGGRGNIDNIIIRNNLIYDDPVSTAYSHQIFIQNIPSSGTNVTGIYIYCNIFKHPPAAGILLEGVAESYIYNNTFYGHNEVTTRGTFHLWVDVGSSNVSIKNNVFFSDLSFHTNGSGLELYCLVDPALVDSDYNLYYRVADNLRIGQIGSVIYTTAPASWAAYKAATGWETHSPAPADPKFVSNDNLHLQAGSPGRGCGLALPEVTLDFEGTPLWPTPCLGSYSSHSNIVVPYFLRSFIEDSNPSEIGLLYDEGLAEILPSTYSFTVEVNSEGRSSNLVIVEGTQVKLELEHPVVSGDIVTVSYKIPVMNPLQSTSGGLVAELTKQPVANNIGGVITVVKEEQSKPDIMIFPNPASEYFKISLGESSFRPTMIRILSMNGSLLFEDFIKQGVDDIQYPINFRSGIYFVQFLSNGMDMGTHKLIVK